MGLLLILALAGAAIAIAATQKPGTNLPANTPDQNAQIAAYAQIPTAFVPRFVEAIKSGNAQTAYAVAAWFRAQGYTRAADLLTQAVDSVAKPPQATAAPAPGTLPTPTTTVAPGEAAQVAAYAQIPTALVPQFVEAIKSGSPQTAYATAAWFRAQGYSHAADLLTQAADSVKPPAGTAAPTPTTPPATASVSVAIPPATASAASPPVPTPAVVPPPQTAAVPSVVLPSSPPTPAPATAPSAGPATAPTPAPTPLPDVSVPAAIPVPAVPAPTTTPTTPTPAATPGQDPPLPPAIKALLENVLRTAHDPAVIYQAADMLQANGFPNTAAELRKRAVAIASSQVDPIALIQDILQHADQTKPPAPAPTSPAIPPGGMPQYPSTTAPASPSAPSGPSAAPSTGPVAAPGAGVSLNIPTQINVPGLSIPPFAAPQVPAPAPGTRYYVVESGDNPSKIAKKFTGDPNRWREMAALNPEANLAAGKIYPGQRLRVPPAWPNTAAAGPVVAVPMPAAAPTTAAPSAPSTSAGGYDPNLARSLAPVVLQDVAANGAKYNHEQLKAFQRAAGLTPDGQYGPRAAGAVEYFASASAPPSLPQYGTGSKPYAPPRSTPPLTTSGVSL